MYIEIDSVFFFINRFELNDIGIKLWILHNNYNLRPGVASCELKEILLEPSFGIPIEHFHQHFIESMPAKNFISSDDLNKRYKVE